MMAKIYKPAYVQPRIDQLGGDDLEDVQEEEIGYGKAFSDP